MLQYLLIGIYVPILFFVYNLHKENLSNIHNQKLQLQTEITQLENKMKIESSKSFTSERKYQEIDPKTKFQKEFESINSEIETITNQVNMVKVSFTDSLKNRLNEELKKFENIKLKDYSNFVPEIKVIDKTKQQKEVTDDLDIEEHKGDVITKELKEGPTSDTEKNKQITKTMFVREMMQKNYQKFLDNENKLDKLQNIWRSYNETDKVEFDTRSLNQWNFLDKISQLEHDISNLQNKFLLKKENIFTNFEKIEDKKDQKCDVNFEEDSEEQILEKYPFTKLEDIDSEIDKKVSYLSTFNDRLTFARTFMDENAKYNFPVSKDYDLLKAHFCGHDSDNKKLKYKKLFSLYEVFNKNRMDNLLKGKSKILFYFELESSRRVGIYMDMAYPRRPKFSKKFKDPKSFIVFFNENEIYMANPETDNQFRSEVDMYLIVGNTKQNDGVWFKNEDKQGEKDMDKDIEKSKLRVFFGKPSNEFKTNGGKLFEDLVLDNIMTFSIFELDVVS